MPLKDKTVISDLIQNAGRRGIRFEVAGDELRVIAPEGALTPELRASLRDNKERLLEMLKREPIERQVAVTPVLEPEHRYSPFPLTDLQHAYWLGRDHSVDLGTVATHLYVELECEVLDTAGLQRALNRLIERHDMLRAVVDAGGMQRVLPEVPEYVIATTDRRDGTPAAVAQAIASMRDELSHQVMDTQRWPLFDVRLTLLPNDQARLHVSLDLLILDAQSIYYFFRDWHRLYARPELEPAPLGVTFRDYVLTEQQVRQTPAHARARAYWEQRLDTLPPAPELPVRANPGNEGQTRFTRREFRLDKARWDRLKASGRDQGLTPSILLLAAYSEVLARWSASPHFTLNMTVSNRLQIHADIPHVLGDFINLLLLEVDRRDATLGFREFAVALQRRLARDMEHSQVSGVSVMRDWARRRGSSMQAAMPVVFSSGLVLGGGEEVGDLEQFGRKVFSISQTSQVWLDQHVVEIKGDLVLVWDAAEELFELGVLDAMFAAYTGLVERLAENPAVWEMPDPVELPPAMSARGAGVNATASEYVPRSLHAGFVARALERPDACALVGAERTLSYGELLGESAAVANWLLGSGVQPGQPVAVVMRKGWEQIVAVYGVLLAGAAYMPVDADWPLKRRQEILAIGEVGQVLTQPEFENDAALRDYAVLAIEPGQRADYTERHARSLNHGLDALAYVIFTSGTTGVPKGVMISHRGAINTIEHINRLFKVTAEDSVLGVSSLSFDLSVYDIFGLHDVGGTLVLPDAAKGNDPVHWRQLIERHQITLWNSAPQLMRMLVDSFARDDASREIASLRTVMLSGDWIPLDLPELIREHGGQVEVISLGGATEASIWSIYFPIQAVDPRWRSVPYGKPLPNQTVWVLDAAMRPCPDWVTGKIYIGGTGLAQGYWKDREMSEAKFVIHPRTGERLYDTGDLGRYAPCGNIIMLGRDDSQIKIRGYRVELGEIETQLRECTGVRRCAVVATGAGTDRRRLVAFVDSEADADLDQWQQELAQRLPDYMIPGLFIPIDRVPVSSNGKVDYRQLDALAEEVLHRQHAVIAPRNPVEAALWEAWSGVMDEVEIGVQDNFFELGGDSVMATLLVREINERLPMELAMHELFENLTIESLARLYDEKRRQNPSLGEQAAEDAESLMQADLDAFRARLTQIRVADADGGIPVDADADVLITGATGWVGSHLLAECLQSGRGKIHCLVRAEDRDSGMARLRDQLAAIGSALETDREARIVPLIGDIEQPRLGLDEAQWQQLCTNVDAIYHLAASTNVLDDYATLRHTNVDPLQAVLELALAHHLKPIYCSSPMTVCRRIGTDGIRVLSEERVDADPQGLLTGYAQSKWVAENILQQASSQGVPVRIYRTSHALPSSRNGLAKRKDTYTSALATASSAAVIPVWPDSAVYGVPVDLYARLLREDSLRHHTDQLVVHIENRTPLTLPQVIDALSGGRADRSVETPESWAAHCRQKAAESNGGGLSRVLFERGPHGLPVTNMFTQFPFDTGYYAKTEQTDRLIGITPEDYWRAVSSHPQFLNA